MNDIPAPPSGSRNPSIDGSGHGKESADGSKKSLPVMAILQSGEIVTGDLIVGADGYHSLVRDYVRDRHDVEMGGKGGEIQSGTAVYS